MKAAAVAVALSIGGWAAIARADVDKAACASSYQEGQRAKLHSELLRAREQLGICAVEACPAAFKTECAQWLDEVNRAMPSIVLRARGRAGTDLTDVRVFEGDKLLTDHLDGKPIDVDPGAHDLRFEAQGEQLPPQHVVVVEGQKEQLVTSSATPPVVVQPRTHRARPLPAATWVSGALMLASGAAFGIFAGLGASDYGNLPACKCGGNEDWVKTEFIIADVALGVAIASLVTTFVIVVTTPTRTIVDRVGFEGVRFRF